MIEEQDKETARSVVNVMLTMTPLQKSDLLESVVSAQLDELGSGPGSVRFAARHHLYLLLAFVEGHKASDDRERARRQVCAENHRPD